MTTYKVRTRSGSIYLIETLEGEGCHLGADGSETIGDRDWGRQVGWITRMSEKPIGTYTRLEYLTEGERQWLNEGINRQPLYYLQMGSLGEGERYWSYVVEVDGRMTRVRPTPIVEWKVIEDEEVGR